MCGIIGVFGKENARSLAEKGMAAIEYRGRDSLDYFSHENVVLGHRLHSIVGEVKQPIFDDNGVFVSNCEIYNWKELDKKYGFNAKNDSELMFKLLLKKGVSEKTLDEFNGVYAFALLTSDMLFIARDIIGEKPVWYSHADGFYFASEKKALEKMGVVDINELNPRKILEYDVKHDELNLVERKFFSTDKETRESLEKIEKKIEELLESAVEKRIPERKFGILFSGGIDSTVLAFLLKKMKKDFVCYTTVIDDPNFKEAEDLSYAKRITKELNLKHKIIKIKPGEIEKQLKTIVPLIEDSNVVKVEVALTFFAACIAAKKDGCKVLFSGLGSEEIFAGYQRHKDSTDINKECVSGLLKLYERDLYRDDVITMYNGIELRLPYLDLALVRYALSVPAKYKLKDGQEKYVLRAVAKNLGIAPEYAQRKKRAAQYGSNVSKIIDKLTKNGGFKLKSEYMKQFYPTHNLRLGALVSSGKDSIYAMYVMQRQNYSVECMITVKSNNPDSYMFHTPTIDLVNLQSKAIGIPVFAGESAGVKEEELIDLKKIITGAKKKYKLDGIITGALFSNYQRDRIEKICDSLSLKIFSPLWHINQETEIREILANGFKFMMTKVACDGLDKSWLGREISEKDIDRLVALNKKIEINVAGEGGEYETLMVGGPIFKNKIVITDSKIVEEDKNTAFFVVGEAKLC